MVEHTCNPVPGYVYRAVHYRGEQSVPVWLVSPERDTDQSRYGTYPCRKPPGRACIWCPDEFSFIAIAKLSLFDFFIFPPLFLHPRSAKRGCYNSSNSLCFCSIQFISFYRFDFELSGLCPTCRRLASGRRAAHVRCPLKQKLMRAAKGECPASSALRGASWVCFSTCMLAPKFNIFRTLWNFKIVRQSQMKFVSKIGR